MSAASMMMGGRFAPLAVSASPASVSGSSTDSTVTSNSATLTITGGSGQRSVAWSWLSGSGAIAAVLPGALSTAFRATGMSVGSVSGVWRATVTDLITGEVRTADVSIYLERGYPALSVSGPADATNTQTSSGAITVSASTSVSASGGVPPYSYSWSYSGDFSMSGSGAGRTFSKSLQPQGGVMGTATVTVTDSIGQSETRTCNVMLINNGVAPPTMNVSASPSSVFGFSNDGTPTTDYTTVSVTGGSGSFSISWSRVAGDGSVVDGGWTTRFIHYMSGNGSADGTFQATVTDLVTGQVKTVTVSAGFSNFIITGP